MKKTYLATVLCIASGNALAGPYIGAGLGDVDAGPGLSSPTGFELMIGTDITPNVSVEASYVDFGRPNDGIPPVWRYDADSLAFGGLLTAPLSPELDVFFKLGLHMWDLSVSEDGFGTFFTDEGTDIFYGFGARFELNSQFSIGGRYMSYDFDGEDIDVLSINAQMNF